MPPKQKKTVAQRLRQGAVDDNLKKLIGSYLRPKTAGLDNILAYTYRRITTGAFGMGLPPLRFFARPGIEFLLERRVVQPGADLYYVVRLRVSHASFASGQQRIVLEGSCETELPPNERNVLQILFLLRHVLTRYMAFPYATLTEAREFRVPENLRVRVTTVLRALDTIRPLSQIQRMIDFLSLFRP